MRLTTVVLRTVRWPVLAAHAAAALAVVVHGRVIDAPAPQFEMRVRVAAALLAAGVGAVVRDDAVLAVQSAPRYRRLGVAARIGAFLVAAATTWLAMTAAVPGPLGDLPLRALAVEAAAWAAASCSFALLVGPSSVSAAVFAGLVAVQLLPQRWTLTSAPGAPDWPATQLRWAAIALVGMAATAWALRDPATPVNRRRRPTRGGRS